MEANNNAKLRAALEKIQDNIYFNDIDGCIEIVIGEDELDKLFKDALAAPARNCDVGTAEEQAIRFGDICWKHHVHGFCVSSCPLFHIAKTYTGLRCHYKCFCFAHWSQMPSKEGGAK